MSRNPDLTTTYFVCQGICEFDIVSVVRSKTQSLGDVNRSSRAWFILQSSQVCLDLATVDLELRLVRKCNILHACAVASAKDHDSVRSIVNTVLKRGVVVELDGDRHRVTVL